MSLYVLYICCYVYYVSLLCLLLCLCKSFVSIVTSILKLVGTYRILSVFVLLFKFL